MTHDRAVAAEQPESGPGATNDDGDEYVAVRRDTLEAISEMLSHTSTQWAPWHVIPADRKWFARIGVAAVIAHTLIELDPRYPKVSVARLREMQQVKRMLEAEAPKQ